MKYQKKKHCRVAAFFLKSLYEIHAIIMLNHIFFGNWYIYVTEANGGVLSHWAFRDIIG